MTNFPSTGKADVVTPIGTTDAMSLSMEAHAKDFLTGFLWYSKSGIRHPLVRYGLRPVDGDVNPDKVRVATATNFWVSPNHPTPSYPTLRDHTSVFNQEKTRDYRGLTASFDIELIGDLELIDTTLTTFTSPKLVFEKWLDPDIEPNVLLSNGAGDATDGYATAFAVYPPELASFNFGSVATVDLSSEDPPASQRYRKAHVSVNLDTVVPDGSNAALDPQSIDKIGVQVVPKGYDVSSPGITYGAAGPVRGQVKITNFTVTVSNPATGHAVLDKGHRAARGHHVRNAIGYEDDYNVTPESLLDDQQQLGHRGPMVDYVGRGKHYALAWNGSSFAVDPVRVLNDTSSEWHTNLFARGKALGRSFVISAAYEVLLNDAPSGWYQMNTDDGTNFYPACTGWDPPSALLSPCKPEAMTFIADTLKGFLALQPVGAKLYFQIGEPWWWDQPFKVPSDTGSTNPAPGHPCFYDFATKVAWLADHGAVIPIVTSTSQATYPPTSHPPGYATLTYRDMWDWLADKLGISMTTIRDAVKATYPAALGTFLIFPPQVFGANFADPGFAETDFPITRYTNWAQSHIEADAGWDFCQAEAYDWIADGPGSLYTPPAPRFDLYNDPTYGLRALFTNPVTAGKPWLGYDLATQYWEFNGYVAAEGFSPFGVAETHEEFLARRREEWKDISRVAGEAQAAGAAQVVIWAWTQEKRDGWVWTGDAQMANLMVMNGPTPPSGKTLSANSSLDVVLLGSYGAYAREHNAVWDVTNACWKPKGDGTTVPDDGTPFYVPGANTGDARPPATQLILRLRFTDGTAQNYEDVYPNGIIASSTNQWEWGYNPDVTFVEGATVSASSIVTEVKTAGDGGAFDAVDRSGGTASHYNFTLLNIPTAMLAVYRVQGGEKIALAATVGYTITGKVVSVPTGHRPNSGESMEFVYV